MFKQPTFHIRFIRKPSNVLYYRITYAGERAGADTTTLLAIKPEHWDAKAQRVLKQCPTADFDNATLAEIRKKITLAKINLENDSDQVTARMIKERFAGKTIHRPTLVQVFRKYLESQKKRVGFDILPASYTKRVQCFKAVMLFLEENSRQNMPPDSFTISECAHLHRQLKQAGYKDSIIKKHFDFVKAAIGFGKDTGLCKNKHVGQYKIKVEESEIVYLEPDQVSAIAGLALAPRLQRVRDLFLFQCWTGLAYADLKRFSPATHITANAAGQRCIKINRQKSNTGAIIPIMEGAQNILANYDGHMPGVGSNTKLNEYLKEIAALAGVPFNLTTHIARKTFAVHCLDNGFSPEVTAKMLGHRDTKTLMRHYGMIRETRVFAEYARYEAMAPAAPKVAKPVPSNRLCHTHRFTPLTRYA